MTTLAKNLVGQQQEQDARIAVLTAMFNNERQRQILTKDNHTVTYVGKHNDSARGTNTLVRVEIDLLHGSEGPVLAKNRYLRIPLYTYRPSLAEAFTIAGFAKNKDGSFVVAGATDIKTTLAAIKDKLVIDENEIKCITVVDGLIGFHAKDDSLGFVGKVTVTATADESEGEPTDPKWNEVVRGTVPSANALDETGTLLSLPNFKPSHASTTNNGSLELAMCVIADAVSEPVVEAELDGNGDYTLMEKTPGLAVIITAMNDLKRDIFEQYNIEFFTATMGVSVTLQADGSWSAMGQTIPSTTVNDKTVQLYLLGLGEGQFSLTATHKVTGESKSLIVNGMKVDDPTKVNTFEITGPTEITELEAVYTYSAKNKAGEEVPGQTVTATANFLDPIFVGTPVVDDVARTITVKLVDDRARDYTGSIDAKCGDLRDSISVKVKSYYSVPIDTVKTIEVHSEGLSSDNNIVMRSFKFYNRLNSEISPKTASAEFESEAITGDVQITYDPPYSDLSVHLPDELRLIPVDARITITADDVSDTLELTIPPNGGTDVVANITMVEDTPTDVSRPGVATRVTYKNRHQDEILPANVTVNVTLNDSPYSDHIISEDKSLITVFHPAEVETEVSFKISVQCDEGGPTQEITLLSPAPQPSP